VLHRPIQVEVVTNLDCSQTVQLVTRRAAAKQIGCSPFDLPGARPAERKLKAAVFQQPVHLIEKLRYLLDFVDDYLAHRAGGGQLFANALRILQVAAVLLGLRRSIQKACG
jgi:transposase